MVQDSKESVFHPIQFSTVRIVFFWGGVSLFFNLVFIYFCLFCYVFPFFLSAS